MLFTVSCEDSDTPVDQVVAGTQRGAILRTSNLISNELPIGVDGGNFSVELEVQDSENGDLVSTVEVFVGFRDNTDDVGPGTDVDESLFGTVSSSTFTTGEFGLPRFTFTATLDELLGQVGRTADQITGGDQFTIRFELVLTDGRRYSFADNTGTLTGSFFSSPFLYTPTVICPIPEGAFTGTYTLTQDTGGIFGRTFTDGPVEITATGGTSRSIALEAYPQFGGFARNFLFDLICDNIAVQTVDTGLACVAGGDTIVYDAADVTTQYDVNDDSTIVIIFNEIGGSCGAGGPVQFTLTK